MNFERFDVAGFLAEDWQRRPRLIRNPWVRWRNPLEPDELAGLACEDGIEARLITGGDGTLKVHDGPFAEDRFADLGEANWTLLVQAVDHHVPEVAALIEPFRFVPDWRIDDVMVSYAADGGGVGPHFDQYDVFLVQGLGQRRWRVGPRCDSTSALVPHDDLRLLQKFETADEWVLDPGDILYVPPGFAHEGTAVGGDCMTYSIGFRAPARSELIAHFTDHVLDGLTDDDRYSDAGLSAQANAGEITAEALGALHAMVLETLGNRAEFDRWFGEFTTQPRYPGVDWRPDRPVDRDALSAAAASGANFVRNPACRFAFVRHGEQSLTLFVNGESHDCTGVAARLAAAVCAQMRFKIEPSTVLDEQAIALLKSLIDHGAVALEDGD